MSYSGQRWGAPLKIRVRNFHKNNDSAMYLIQNQSVAYVETLSRYMEREYQFLL